MKMEIIVEILTGTKTDTNFYWIMRLPQLREEQIENSVWIPGWSVFRLREKYFRPLKFSLRNFIKLFRSQGIFTLIQVFH